MSKYNERAVSSGFIMGVGMFGILIERGWQPLWWVMIFVGLIFSLPFEDEV